MAKSKDSMNDFLTKIRGQASTAHADEVVSESILPAKVEDTKELPTEPVTKNSKQSERPKKAKAIAEAPKKRRSLWHDPYPESKPYQTTIWVCEEDPMTVKQLKLKLRFSKEWQVYKYALEELAKREGIK
jgi:hypothetical protein